MDEFVRLRKELKEKAGKEELSKLQGDIAQQSKASRVTPLNTTRLNGAELVQINGVPEYVSDISKYAAYGITKTGWFAFARVAAKAGVTVSSGFAVTGADGYITPTNGSNYVDIAVCFGVAPETKTVTINWGKETESFAFKATDLAVRNLDYRTTFYVYDIAPYATETADKIKFEGMVQNVTYKYASKITKGVEIVLPTVDSTDGHGVWMELQLLFDGAHSCTLTTLDGTAVICNSASPAIKKGYNVLDLMYYDIDGVKAWRVQNTTSNITNM